MRINPSIATVAIVALVVLTSKVRALEPPINLSRAVHPIDGPADAGDHSGPPTVSGACPATNEGVLNSGGGTIVGSTIGSTDDFVAGCSSVSGGQDEIFEFTVDRSGLWAFDSCTVPACWETTLEIREETGGGCPGDFVACDIHGCNVCGYESYLPTFLLGGLTYYLIVDGWSTFSYGDFVITYINAEPGCVDDADCDDGLFCNGAETCDVPTAMCLGGLPPCRTFEGYSAPCDEAAGSCPKPDSCLTWTGGGGSAYFFPESNHCPDLASWVFDDIQGSHHTTGLLDYYTTPILARSTPPGASPLGTSFLVNLSLFTAQEGTCYPEAQIDGAQCTEVGFTGPSAAPVLEMSCSIIGTMPPLPNNAGEFNLCEIDFWMAYRTTENGAGFWIAAEKPLLGGPAAADDFGMSIIALEDCPPTGNYQTVTFFGDDENLPADFATARVCQKPGGSCCHPDGSCSQTSEAECDGDFGATGTINGTDGGCGGDPDGDGIDNRCGDNCPDVANPGQEDCDGDGIGDACEAGGATDEACCDAATGSCYIAERTCCLANGDTPNGPGSVCTATAACCSSGTCEVVDPLCCIVRGGVPQAPGTTCGECGSCCLTDGDCLDNIVDSTCEAIGRSFNGAGSTCVGDSDGDGIDNNCDICPGVDDAVFAPECQGRIPTVSEWGLLVLALLLLVAGKVYFGRRQALA